MKLSVLVAAAFALAIGVVTAQTQDKVLTADLTLKTLGHTTAVHGKSADPKVGDFLFCIDQDRAGAAKAVNFTGQGRVIYRPTPVPGMPDAMAGRTPESVASVLTVIAGTGEAWVFVAKGQAPLPGRQRSPSVSCARQIGRLHRGRGAAPTFPAA
jgi:hypothetical protein